MASLITAASDDDISVTKGLKDGRYYLTVRAYVTLSQRAVAPVMKALAEIDAEDRFAYIHCEIRESTQTHVAVDVRKALQEANHFYEVDDIVSDGPDCTDGSTITTLGINLAEHRYDEWETRCEDDR